MAEESKQPKQIPQEYAEKLKAARAQRAMQGERRVVSILFCDVVGSTSMAEQLDPEDWAEIMDEAFDYLMAPIFRYEGTVARLMGDAVLAFFGAPLAHEDDPQRAVLAGLGILEGIRPFCERIKQDYGLEFNVRVGINTGSVVVGEIGSDLQMEYTAMGDAVNLAARMEQSADAGSVQISQATYKHIAALFEVEELGEIDVKGKSEPQQSYRVIAPKAAPERTRGIRGLVAPMIGRQAEFEAATSMVRSLKEGRGGLLMLMGEAGLGKSRLIEEMRHAWDQEGSGSAWHETRGISYDATRPYSLFRHLLRAYCGINDQDSPQVVQEKAHDTVAAAPEHQREALREVVRILLEVETMGGAAPVGEALKSSLFKNLMTVIEAEAGNAPLAIVLDDLHWADPTSIELLEHLLKLVETSPVLFICAMRPHRKTPGWRIKQVGEGDYPHRYQEIHLKPLSAEQSQELVDSLLDISELPPELHQLIMRKAEGNPFFVEEVVRSLIDGGYVQREGEDLHWVSTRRVADIDIPDNLQGLLSARIDRLQQEARRTLQLAAVIGRSFYYRVLEAISELRESLDSQLNTLQRLELIREAARQPELEYKFLHELTRDAAYSTILRRQRREFHRQVAEAIETLFPEQLDEESHRLAYHFAQAEDDPRALHYCRLAGKASMRLYANREAADHFKEAIHFALRLEVGDEELIELYTKAGRALELSGGYEEAIALYKELERKGEEERRPALVLAAVTPQATIFSVPTEHYDGTLSKELTDRALMLARELNDKRAEAKALWNKMLVSYFIDGQSRLSLEYGAQAQDIARTHGLKEELAFVLHDSVRPYMSTGEVEKAGEMQAEALELWREMGNLPMIADNLTMASTNHYYQARFDRALELGEEALRISRSIDSLWGQAYSLNNLAPVYFEIGEVGTSIRYFEESFPLAREANFLAAQFSSLHLSMILVELGAFDQAASYANRAGEMVADGDLMLGRYVRTLDAFVKARRGDAHEAWQILDTALNDFQELNIEAVNTSLVEPVRVEVALANKKYDDVLQLTREVLESPKLREFRLLHPKMLLFQAKAFFMQGNKEGAHKSLENARAMAAESNSRMNLWRIEAEMYLQAQVNGDQEAAAAHHRNALDLIEYIAARFDRDDLKKIFLATREVKNILD